MSYKHEGSNLIYARRLKPGDRIAGRTVESTVPNITTGNVDVYFADGTWGAFPANSKVPVHRPQTHLGGAKPKDDGQGELF